MHDHAILASLRNKARKFSGFFFVRIYSEQLNGSCNKILKLWVEVLIAYRIDSAYRVSHFPFGEVG